MEGDCDLSLRVKELNRGDRNTQKYGSLSTKWVKLLRWCDTLLLADPVHGCVVRGTRGRLTPYQKKENSG